MGIRLQRWTRTGNQKRKELCSLSPPLHKSIMSLFCLNCLRSVAKCLCDKCVSSTAAAANPSSPPPCHTPKPQSLCSDHSGFPMFSSEIQRVLNQVNISHLLPESVPPLGHCHLCADRRQRISLRAPKSIASVEKEKAYTAQETG